MQTMQNKMGRLMGLEPTTTEITTRGSTNRHNYCQKNRQDLQAKWRAWQDSNLRPPP